MKKKYLWCFLIFFGKLGLHFSKFFSFYACIPSLELTLWEPGYDIFVLWFQPKTAIFGC